MGGGEGLPESKQRKRKAEGLPTELSLPRLGEVGGGWTDITAFSGTCQQTEYLSALTAAHP